MATSLYEAEAEAGVESSAAAAAAAEAEETDGFAAEIGHMLHGFGDNPQPHADTARLVEGAVLQQLRGLVREASRLAELRGARHCAVANRDVIFLMRRDKRKLKRLLDYQAKVELVRAKSKLVSSADNPVPDVLLEDDVEPWTKRQRTHRDVIKNLDFTGEVEQVNFDEIKLIRNLRAAKMTEAMSLTKYQAYHKARCVSFKNPGLTKNSNKFKKWIDPNDEINLLPSAIDVLAYLAFETVAEIVDIVFLVRQDAKKRSDDPFSKYGAGNFCNPASLSNSVYIKSGYEGVSPITVAEVREALRRIFTPKVGISGLFYRRMNNDLPPKFIAC